MKVVFKENRESVRQAPSKPFELSYPTPRRQNINGGGEFSRIFTDDFNKGKIMSGSGIYSFL
jgi:hypothetical protein